MENKDFRGSILILIKKQTWDMIRIILFLFLEKNRADFKRVKARRVQIYLTIGVSSFFHKY